MATLKRPLPQAVLILTMAAAVLAGCGSQPAERESSPGAAPSGGASTVVKTPSPAPSSSAAATRISAADRSALAGQTFYVNPNGHGVVAHKLLSNMHEYAEAAKINKIARQPTALWFAGGPTPKATAATLTSAAAKAHRTAVIVVYSVPQRDCGQHSAGGATDPAAYLSYVSQIAAGLRGPTVVILEPDAIPFTLSGCTQVDAVQRYHLLGQAVDILVQSRAGIKVYIDAGNSSWITDLDRLANALQASGVERAAGFSLNVSNYNRTSDTVAYGRKLSARLKGTHFVIDTSRNGAGPLHQGERHTWCNPAGRRLGTPPTTDTGLARVDAFLWIKQPGDSDGKCAPGQPKAGEWWERGALALIG